MMAHLVRSRTSISILLRSPHYVRYLSGESSSNPSNRPIPEEPLEPLSRPPSNPWFLRPPSTTPNTSSPPSVPSPNPAPAVLAKPTPPTPSPPKDAPPLVLTLHKHLLTLPQIDPLTLYSGPPIFRPYTLDTPSTPPRGKRNRRAGPTSGEKGFGEPGSVWKWVVVGQVREGTEGRGSVEAVVRSVRAALQQHHPQLPLPPRSRKPAEDGWSMLDLGDTALHVLSRSARAKWFSDEDVDEEEQRIRQMYGGMPFWFKRYTYTE